MDMATIENSQLYRYLMFLRKHDPGYNVKEVFNLVLGYQLASDEEWIAKFNTFVDKHLIIEYYSNNVEKLPKNYGNVIYENQSDDKDGLDKFYSLLKDFITQEANLSNRS